MEKVFINGGIYPCVGCLSAFFGFAGWSNDQIFLSGSVIISTLLNILLWASAEKPPLSEEDFLARVKVYGWVGICLETIVYPSNGGE